jgi:methylated-DNA-protein-cysteine methyltransferase-like protein
MSKDKKSSKERLAIVNPSGKREESTVGLIHDLVRQIPRGRVTSYGAIAKVLNLPNPRMVGRAMRFVEGGVPAQRVVNSTGKITGEHNDARRKALLKEGVEVKNDRVLDFKNLFWDPAVEL